ncbi:hypothetical protein GCM10009593_27170 [Microlunatus antarcticus]
MASSGWVANRTARWLGFLFLGIAGASLAGLALSPDGSSLVNVTISVVMIAILVIAIRYLRAGLQLSPIGFVSRGDFWTRELRWSDVADIEGSGLVHGCETGVGFPCSLLSACHPTENELVVALRSGLSERG